MKLRAPPQMALLCEDWAGPAAFWQALAYAETAPSPDPRVGKAAMRSEDE